MSAILILVKNLTSGGAEKQSVVLAKTLALKCKVHYIVFNGNNVHDKYLQEMNNVDNLCVLRLHGNFLSKIYKIVNYIKENDIRYAFSYLTAANAVLAISSFFVDIKSYIGLRNSRLPFLKMISDRFILNYLVTGAVVNCFSGKEEFVKKGFEEDKLHVIQNAFENITERVEPIKGSNKYRIISVGRFVPQKDYSTAIKSISLLKHNIENLEYLIVGYGELENQIRKLIELNGLGDVVKVYINPSNIEELLRSSNVYLSTSIFEGTSNSIMEAMNSNLPIVATNVGDNNCLVKNEENGFLLDIGDFENIYKKILYLYNNPDKCDQFGLKSKEILKYNFSVEKFFSSYEKLLEI